MPCCPRGSGARSACGSSCMAGGCASPAGPAALFACWRTSARRRRCPCPGPVRYAPDRTRRCCGRPRATRATWRRGAPARPPRRGRGSDDARLAGRVRSRLTRRRAARRDRSTSNRSGPTTSRSSAVRPSAIAADPAQQLIKAGGTELNSARTDIPVPSWSRCPPGLCNPAPARPCSPAWTSGRDRGSAPAPALVPGAGDDGPTEAVRAILDQVRRQGDPAVRELTRQVRRRRRRRSARPGAGGEGGARRRTRRAAGRASKPPTTTSSPTTGPSCTRRAATSATGSWSGIWPCRWTEPVCTSRAGGRRWRPPC